MALVVFLALVAALAALALAEGPGDPTAAGDGSAEGAAAEGEAAEAEATAEELETFVPTEKVPADTAVAFPVDI